MHAVTEPGPHFRENPGIYFAKGTGRSCDEAFRNARIEMMDRFDYLACTGGRITCGPNGGPFVSNRAQCERGLRGVHTAWAQCDNVFHSDPPSRPTPDTSASGLILIEAARRGEVRARASRIRD